MPVHRLALLAIVAATSLIATLVAWRIFERMPHVEDEHAYLYQAQVFASGRLSATSPPHPDSFFVAFVIDRDGKRFGKYPPGYPLVLALGVLVGQPWIINVLAAALAVLGVYLLGRDLFDQTTGWVAALLGVFSPLHILLSGTLLSHYVTLVALTFFAWAFVRSRRPDEPHPYRLALLAGVLLGLAAITRPFTALAMGAPFAVLGLLDVIRGRGRLVDRYATMAIACLVITMALPLYNLAMTGSPFTNLYTLWWQYDKVGFGEGYGRWNHTVADGFENTRLMLEELQTMLTGWPVVNGIPLAGVVAALGLGWPPCSRREWGILTPAVMLMVAHMAYWMPSFGMFGPRYYSEALPFLWLVLARGVVKVGAQPWPRRAILVALPLLVIWGAVYVTYPRLTNDMALYDISRQDEQHIKAAGLRHALVFVETPYWTNYGSVSWLNAPDLPASDIIYAEDLGVTQNSLVMADYPGRDVYYYSRLKTPNLVTYRP